MHTAISPIEPHLAFSDFSEKSLRSSQVPGLKRLTGLKSVLQKLQAGQFVSNRSLGRHLSQKEFQDYLDVCQQQRDWREKFKNKPVEVEVYQIDLKRADFNGIQAAAYQEQGDCENTAIFLKLSQNQNHSLLKRLQQQIQLRPELQDWFDRPVLSISEDILTCENMPRVVTSFSRFKRDNHPFGIINVAKQDLKIKAVVDAYQLLSETLKQKNSSAAL